MIRFDHQVGSKPSTLQEKAIQEAYTQIYAFVQACPGDHFVFTSSGAEAVNHAVFSAYLDIARKTGKNHFLCGELDEAPAILALTRLQELGCVFQMVPANSEGVITKEAVQEMITPRTAFLSLSGANGLTGTIQPTQEIGELCKQRGILFHLEASHLLGRVPFTLHESGADVVTFEGEAAGTGGLFLREGKELSPLILGGNEQGGMRGGKVASSALIELGRSAHEKKQLVDHVCMEVARLKAMFERLLKEKLPGVRILFEQSERLPDITCAQFAGITSDALAFVLKQKGVLATFGGGRFQHLMHLLKACGLSAPEYHTGLSFGFSPRVTQENILIGVEKIVDAVSSLTPVSHHIFTMQDPSGGSDALS